MTLAKAIPDGVQPVIPMLVCRDAAAEIEFCKSMSNKHFRLVLIILTVLMVANCSHNKTATPSAAPHVDPEPIQLLVENRTDQELGVFIIEQNIHTRLGTVEKQSTVALAIRPALLGGKTAFRVYAFRGAEACPVARQIDLRFSNRPRMTVAPVDTVLSGYLPADVCGRKASK